jgi:hypothetical protein
MQRYIVKHTAVGIGGRNAMAGEVMDAKELAGVDVDRLVRVGAIDPILSAEQLEEEIDRIQAEKGIVSPSRVKELEDEIERLNKFIGVMSVEEQQAVRDRLVEQEAAEAEAEAETKAKAEEISALSKPALQEKAKELGLEFKNTTTVPELREMILAAS